MLSLHPRRGMMGIIEDVTLQCTGTEDLDISDPAKRAGKLQAYQGEIQEFAAFLKQQYFEA